MTLGFARTAALPPAKQSSPTDGPFVNALLVTFVFLLISRLPEFLASAVGLEQFRIMLVVASCAILVSLFSGRFLVVFASASGKWLMAFFVWVVVTTLTSEWHRGSLALLTDIWLRSWIVFPVVATLVGTWTQTRKIFHAVAIGSAAASILIAINSPGSEGDRLQLAQGTFGNANRVAFQLLLGIPFCALFAADSKWFGRIAIWAAAGLSLFIILQTGSRGGVVILAALLLIGFVTASVMNKLKLLICTAIIGGVGFAFVPQNQLDRYLTLANVDQNDVSRSAVESSDSRRALLLTSLELSLEHPLLGSGPGIFAAISADFEKEQGLRPHWQETHNTYTQVSSETGIPGLVIFLGLLGSLWVATFRVARKARSAGNLPILRYANCLRFALIVFTIQCIFDSMAYLFYMPLLTGLTVVLEQTSKPLLEHVPAKPAALQPILAHTASPLLQPVRAKSTASGVRIGFGGYRPARREVR